MEIARSLGKSYEEWLIIKAKNREKERLYWQKAEKIYFSNVEEARKFEHKMCLKGYGGLHSPDECGVLLEIKKDGDEKLLRILVNLQGVEKPCFSSAKEALKFVFSKRFRKGYSADKQTLFSADELLPQPIW